MSVKVLRRITSIFLAAAMLVSCLAFEVFAAKSPTVGSVTSAAMSTTQHVGKKKTTLDMKNSNAKITKIKLVTNTSKKKQVKIKNNGQNAVVPTGACYEITLQSTKTKKNKNTERRWAVKGSVKNNKTPKAGKNATCNKTKGATRYKFVFTSKDGKQITVISKTNECEVPKGYGNGTFRVAPVKKVKGKEYVGALS